MLRNYNNYKPYLFPSFRFIHLKRQYFNHGFDSPPLHLPLNDLLKESKVPTITEILKLFYVNLLIIFLLVTISLSWLRKSRAHNVNLCFKCILSGNWFFCNQPVDSLKDLKVNGASEQSRRTANVLYWSNTVLGPDSLLLQAVIFKFYRLLQLY